MAELLWLRLLRKKLGSLFGGSLDPSKLRDCVPSCVWAWAASTILGPRHASRASSVIRRSENS